MITIKPNQAMTVIKKHKTLVIKFLLIGFCFGFSLGFLLGSVFVN